jgi:uncharacterized protein YjiS (DUF1127 family)
MSTMNLSVTPSNTYHVPNWNELKRYLIEWQQSAHSRHELMMLSDRELSDVGLAPVDVHSEVRKSFWR